MGFIPFKTKHETPALAEQTRMFFACKNNRIELKPVRVLLLFLLQLKQEAIQEAIQEIIHYSSTFFNILVLQANFLTVR